VFLRFLREILEFLVDAMDPVLLQQGSRGKKVEKFWCWTMEEEGSGGEADGMEWLWM
jgi:hypothetical protein